MQVLLTALITASEIAVIAIGVSMCYSILRFTNFAQIQYAVVGAYLLYALAEIVGLPLIPAAALAIVLTGGLAVLVDALVFARLRMASPEAKMIASWGVALFLRSVVAAVFGGSALYIDVAMRPLPMPQGVFFTTLDLTVVLAALGFMVLLHVALHHTRLGTALRAMSSNFNLAQSRGIPTGRMIRLMWFIAGAFAALGGILLALETQLTPAMDMTILLPVFAAVTIGGMGNVFGAAIGAFVLALAQNLLLAVDFGALAGGASWFLPAQFKDLVAVVALVAVLLLNLQGRLGRLGRAAR